MANIMRRGDGGKRSQSATTAALNLLGKVRALLTPEGAWGKGDLYCDQDLGGSYQPEYHKGGSRCILGGISKVLGLPDGAYPGTGPGGPESRGPVTVRMLAETINGDITGRDLENTESILYIYNDEKRTTQDDILDLLDRTIEYAERNFA